MTGHAKDDLLSGVLPQFFPVHWLEDAPEIVFTGFPSRIRIGYVQRKNNGYSYVMHSTLQETGVTLGILHQAALHNLDALSNIQLTIGSTPGGPEAFLNTAEDNFQAARILLPRVQNSLAQKLGAEYYAAIPCRDWFICWSKNQSQEWKDKNISGALSDFLNDDYNLTPGILLKSETGFSVHLLQEPWQAGADNQTSPSA